MSTLSRRHFGSLLGAAVGAAALARLHGVAPERIVLGCGSSEVLRMADAAFLGPGKTLVAAEPTFEAVLAYARVTSAETVRVPLTAGSDVKPLIEAFRARKILVGRRFAALPTRLRVTIGRPEEMTAFLSALREIVPARPGAAT